jgi:hypothetical protein
MQVTRFVVNSSTTLAYDPAAIIVRSSALAILMLKPRLLCSATTEGISNFCHFPCLCALFLMIPQLNIQAAAVWKRQCFQVVSWYPPRPINTREPGISFRVDRRRTSDAILEYILAKVQAFVRGATSPAVTGNQCVVQPVVMER